jgi:hypothetical protein
VKFAWLEPRRRQPLRPGRSRARAFLAAQGRRKFVRPLFLALHKDEAGAARSRSASIPAPARSTTRSVDESGRFPDQVFLYRAPILLEWSEGEDSLEHLVAHVLIHEIGHHFGLSDEDMHALEEAAA